LHYLRILAGVLAMVLQQTHLLVHLLAISAQGIKNDSRHIRVKVLLLWS
jgi:hypothetical protein